MYNFFAVGQPGYVLLILVFLVCIAALLYMNRRQKPPARADILQKKYAFLTAAALSDIPDDEVVTAVIANIMNKLPAHHPDPLIALPQLSRGRNAVYFSWLLCRETETGGVAALLKKPAARFVSIGIESLSTVGAVKTAAALHAYRDTPNAETAAMLESALTEEQPLVLCRALIRSLPEEFTDAEPAEASEK